MSWNRKSLLKEGRKAGFTGKTAAEFAEWADENGVSFKTSDGMELSGKNLETAFNKTVTITADAGEDVVINDPEMVEEGDELDDEEVKAADGEEEEDVEKRFQAFRASEKAAKARSQAGATGIRKAAVDSLGGRKARIGDALSAKKMMYDRKIKSGVVGKNAPFFLNAERSEAFGAAARLTSMGNHDYSQKKFDERILAKGAAGVNSTGGALIFYEELPELIENIEQNGAARQAIGVTNMRDGEQTVSKITADVTMYDVGEGDAITSSDPTFGNVKLVATKTAALVKENSELLNDSAFNIGDVLARSISRAVGTWEDESIFLGSHNRQGVHDILATGGTNVFDAAVASWSAYTVGDVQDTLALLPAWAFDDPNFGIVCSLSFAHAVLFRFGMSAGGNTSANLVAGNNQLTYDGFPIYISNVMPKAFTDGRRPMLVGAWSNACKMGVVSGSEQMATSDQRYFDQDQVAFRYTQRWAHSLHTVNATAFGSGIVALQD